MILKKAALLCVFILAGSLTLKAKAFRASGFGPYSSISHEVSASYAQVSRDKWTWKFLNNSDSTIITYMTFTYNDKDGEHSGVVASKIKPGSSLGGFAANSRPTITIKKIKRAPQFPSAKANSTDNHPSINSA